MLTLLILLVALAWLWRWLAGPSPIPLTSPATRRNAFRTTLHNGAPGARVRLQLVNNPGLYVDFKKVIHSHAVIGLTASIKRLPRSAAHFETVRDTLASRGIAFELVVSARGDETLEIDVGRDFARAELVAKCVFEEALGLDLARDVVGFYKLVLITNEPSITRSDEI